MVRQAKYSVPIRSKCLTHELEPFYDFYHERGNFSGRPSRHRDRVEATLLAPMACVFDGTEGQRRAVVQNGRHARTGATLRMEVAHEEAMGNLGEGTVCGSRLAASAANDSDLSRCRVLHQAGSREGSPRGCRLRGSPEVPMAFTSLPERHVHQPRRHARCRHVALPT